MSRILKTSGFLGLAVMMVVGLYQFVLLERTGALPEGLMGGHAHLGVLSILAVVVGFTVDALDLAGRVRSLVTGLYLVGQWALPLTIWIGLTLGVGVLMPTTFLWGLCLIVAMLLLAWQTWTTDATLGGGRTGLAPADD
jgi:hypothetical protein